MVENALKIVLLSFCLKKGEESFDPFDGVVDRDCELLLYQFVFDLEDYKSCSLDKLKSGPKLFYFNYC